MANFKIEFAGYVQNTEPVKTFDNFKFQKINIKVPPRLNEFNEPIGKEKIFPVQASNDKIELINKLSKGDKVKVEAFVDARTSITGTEESYFLQLNLFKIQLIEPAKQY